MLSVISDPTQATFHTCVSAVMFDLTYTAVILQNVLLVTEKYILKNRSEVSPTSRSEVSGYRL